MTKKIQLLRGTTAQNDAFTGSAGELTVDITTHELRVHDGSTAGGHAIATKSEVYTKTQADTLLSAKADDNAVVHLAGAETITGAKTFTANTTIAHGANPTLFIKNTDNNSTTAPSSNEICQVLAEDKNNVWTGGLQVTHSTSGANSANLLVRKQDASVSSVLTIGYDASGKVFTGAPTPATNDNSTQIATTEWVHANAANLAMPSDSYVDLTLGASDTYYTAPADGYFLASKTANSGQYFNGYIVPANSTDRILGANRMASINGVPQVFFLPARKGQRLYITYTASGTTNLFRFVYAQGAV